jgi:hypothetical protein
MLGGVERGGAAAPGLRGRRRDPAAQEAALPRRGTVVTLLCAVPLVEIEIPVHRHEVRRILLLDTFDDGFQERARLRSLEGCCRLIEHQFCER